MGGALLLDNLRWASTMFAYNSRPPDPAVVGDRWRELWLARLRGSGLWLDTWLRHQRRDAFWRQGSVCEDFSAIECPVFAVGGWADAYSNAVPRLMAGLDVPRQGLIGPWAHRYPAHGAARARPIGFLQIALRWWDHWLKDRDDRRSMASRPSASGCRTASARRRARDRCRAAGSAERAWPSPRITPRRYVLHPARLAPEAGARGRADAPVAGDARALRGPLVPLPAHAGPAARPAARGRGRAHVRHRSAARATRDPGRARGRARPSPSTGRVALVAARLSDVAPDGAATRVSYGLLNLTHRESHEHPTALEPGRRYRVRLQLNDLAQAFPAGPPHPPRALDGVLADRLAGARAGDADPLRRGERPHAARAAAGPGRRRAPAAAAGRDRAAPARHGARPRAHRARRAA